MRQIYHPRRVRQSRLQRFGMTKFRSVRLPGTLSLSVFSLLVLSFNCGRRSTDTVATTRPDSADSDAKAAAILPTVASLAPAATDLIIAIGAANHLVAVSNYDPPRRQTADLPTAGDYQNTNWETLATVHPSIIVVQMDPQRIPPGLRDRAVALGAALLVIRIETLADIFRTIDELGTALHENARSSAISTALRDRLDAIRRRVADLPLVPTLISLSDSGSSAAGPGTYLDELLTIAGGRNVLAGTSAHWPSLDRERLTALSPAAVIELLPNAGPQTVQAARQFWSGISSDVDRQFASITEPWALTPGEEVGDLAERMAAALHPTTRAFTPSTAGSVSP